MLVAGGAAAWPVAARAQQSGRVRRIAILMGGIEGDLQHEAGLVALRDALEALGWTDGQNLKIDIRWTHADVERMRAVAKELVGSHPDLIVAHTTQPTAALQRETKTIPIVFLIVSDPVGSGFVASLPRPGGNITGFISVEASLGGKWVEILKEVDDKVARIAVLFDQKTSPEGGSFYLRLIQDAARSIGVETIATPAENAAAIEQAFDRLKGVPNLGLILQPDVTITANRAQIIALAAKHHLPAVYPFRFFTTEGGLASYGIDVIDSYKRAATYVDRILRGENAGELAVQAPVKFELAINLKTAKALGLQLSPMLLGRADEVTE